MYRLKLMLDLDDADNLGIKPFDVELYVGDDQNLLFTRALENRPELVAAEHVADSSHCQEAY